MLDDEDEEMAVESMSDPVAEAAGEERHVAILFVDIRGFTAFAERLLPYDVIHALNRYYHQSWKNRPPPRRDNRQLHG